MKPHRLTELDAMRGLAALAVLLFHFTAAYQYLYSIGRYGKNFTMHTLPPFTFNYGNLGVHLFFMISGFVIFMTLNNTKKPLDFVVSRFSRLYPAYWAVLFINLFLALKIHPSQFLINATMLSAWFKSDYVMQVSWTLTAELSFYTCMLILFSMKLLKYIEALGLAWLCVMMFDIRLGALLGVHAPWIIQQSKLLIHGNLFFAGILFYKIKFEGVTWQRNACLVLCWLTQFIVAREYYPTPIALILFFALFYLFCFDMLTFLRNRVFVFFGTISYSLYLIHENFGTMILRLLDGVKSNFYVNFIIAAGCSILMGYAITVLIEQPVMKWIRAAYKQRAVTTGFKLVNNEIVSLDRKRELCEDILITRGAGKDELNEGRIFNDGYL
ncbi:MAG: acyltransferase [Candidatus Omnitrophica bacterium]|nr:acyltransferase [Candidatus Omnitrophota bacterium]